MRTGSNVALMAIGSHLRIRSWSYDEDNTKDGGAEGTSWSSAISSDLVPVLALNITGKTMNFSLCKAFVSGLLSLAAQTASDISARAL